MKRSFIIVAALAAVAAGATYYAKRGTDASAAGVGTGASGGSQRRGNSGSPGGFPGFGGPGFGGPGGFGQRLPMTVELSAVARADMTEHLTVVGNLIGAATVEA